MSATRYRSVVMLTADHQIDRRILNEADSLESAGWTVTIISLQPNVPIADDPRVIRIPMSGSPAYRKSLLFRAHDRLKRHFSLNGPFIRRVKQLTWRHLIDLESFYINLFLDTASRYRPQVFVAHDLPMLPPAYAAAKLCGSQLVYDSHELFTEQGFLTWERRRWAKIEKKYISQCDVVITVNPSIAMVLEQRYGLSGVKVVYSAARTHQLPAKTRQFHEKFQLALDRKVLLLQGGLAVGRNLDVLVDAMRYVRNASVVLVILGDGDMLQSLQNRSQDMAGKVYFHPAVAQNELLKMTISADAGVIPYKSSCLNNHYCTPNKLFEFIAAGLPVLATDLPEIRRIVEGHQIGCVGDTSTPKKFARLIDDFFSDEDRLKTWSENASKARNRICWEVEEKKLLEIYQTLHQDWRQPSSP